MVILSFFIFSHIFEKIEILYTEIIVFIQTKTTQKMPKFLNKEKIFTSIRQNEKMKKAKQAFREEGLRIAYEKRFMPCEFRDPTMFRSILIMKGNTEVAHFDLSGECVNGEIDCLSKAGESENASTVSMSIGIDDDEFPQLKGIQLSRIMMWSAITKLMEECVDMTQDVYIDVDASAGFWSTIGMEINDNERGPIGTKGRGYEKKISLNRIEKWCTGL